MDGPAQERENRGKRIQFDRQQQHREWMLRRYTHLPGIAQKSIFVNHYTFTSVIPSCSFTFARVIPTHLIFLLILFGLLQVYWTCLQTYCVRVCEIMLYNYFCLFSLAANHKKRLLHRWLEIHHEEGGRQDECEMETEPPKEVVAQDEEPERPSSSLFEDFSDDDFDEREENGTSKEGVKMDTDSAVEREKLEEKEIDTVTVTPPTSPPIVATKPVSSQIQPSPVADNSPPTPPLQFSPAIESYTQETAPEKTDVKNDETEMDVSLPQPSTKILVVTETISPQPVNLLTLFYRLFLTMPLLTSCNRRCWTVCLGRQAKEKCLYLSIEVEKTSRSPRGKRDCATSTSISMLSIQSLFSSR